MPAIQPHQWQELLYDVETDWREMHPLNLSDPHYRNISEHMRQRLPPVYAEGCRTAVPPAAPVDTTPFQLTWSAPGASETLYIAAAADAYHAAVVLAGARSVSRELSTFRLGGSSMEVELDSDPENASTSVLALMLKHAGDPSGGDPCASGKSAEVLLGPPGTWALSLVIQAGVEAGSGVMLAPAQCSGAEPSVCIVPARMSPSSVKLALGPCGDEAIFTRVNDATSTTA